MHDEKQFWTQGGGREKKMKIFGTQCRSRGTLGMTGDALSQRPRFGN